MNKRLLDDKQIKEISRTIAIELANRNLFALRDLHRFIVGDPKTEIGKQSSFLYSLVRDFLQEDNNFEKLLNIDPAPQWISYALFMGRSDKGYDIDEVAKCLCMAIVNQKTLNIDDHVKCLSDTSLFKELNIDIDDQYLVNVSNDRFEIKRQGVILDKNILVYPHQFMRRYYSANFVDLPALLHKAIESGAEVCLRLDPLRQTSAENYFEIWEFDYWHGPKFSHELLNEKVKNERTLHSSRGVQDLNYDARFTVFRTKMMDQDIREFMVEEYCPLELPSLKGKLSPGVGTEFYIQKFAHLCYDQEKQCFSHLDGAVRVFGRNEYSEYFKIIESGGDVEEKIGTRHKMFLVEGELNTDLVQEILTEWFRYNPHIEEYFTGENVEPIITYEQLERIASQ